MRWKISPKIKEGLNRKVHDPRTLDLLAVVALLVFVLGSGLYLTASLAPSPSTTAFMVPGQNVHW